MLARDEFGIWLGILLARVMVWLRMVLARVGFGLGLC